MTLKFAIAAPTRAAFIERRNAFVAFLKAGDKGWLSMAVTELGRTYRIYYRECGNYTHFQDTGGSVAGLFTIKFREPDPEL